MKWLKRAGLSLLATFLVIVGAAAWATRPVSAQEQANDTYLEWCKRIHNEIFFSLPAEVRQHLVAMHGK